MYEGIHQRRRRTGFVTVTEPGDDVADQLCRAVLSLYINIEQQMWNHRIACVKSTLSKTTFVFQVTKFITPTLSISLPYTFVNLERRTKVRQNVQANLHIHVHVSFCYIFEWIENVLNPPCSNKSWKKQSSLLCLSNCNS